MLKTSIPYQIIVATDFSLLGESLVGGFREDFTCRKVCILKNWNCFRESQQDAILIGWGSLVATIDGSVFRKTESMGASIVVSNGPQPIDCSSFPIGGPLAQRAEAAGLYCLLYRVEQDRRLFVLTDRLVLLIILLQWGRSRSGWRQAFRCHLLMSSETSGKDGAYPCWNRDVKILSGYSTNYPQEQREFLAAELTLTSTFFLRSSRTSNEIALLALCSVNSRIHHPWDILQRLWCQRYTTLIFQELFSFCANCWWH